MGKKSTSDLDGQTKKRKRSSGEEAQSVADATIDTSKTDATPKDKSSKRSKKAAVDGDDEGVSLTNGDEKSSKRRKNKDGQAVKASETTNDVAEGEDVEVKKSKKKSKDKKSKSKTVAEDTIEDDDQSEQQVQEEATEVKTKDKKEKKEKKDKKSKEEKRAKKSKKADSSNEEDKPAEDVDGDEEDVDAEADEDVAGDEKSEKQDRHIVFVGNLPYTATEASIRQHFAALEPISVRCLTERDEPSRCRGIAFVEFGKVWHQRAALGKFHHSMFEDPAGKAEPRRINVELTAGGGGASTARQEKIKAKNEKLGERRIKKMQSEQAAKDEKRKQASGDDDGTADGPENSGIHPARLAMMAEPEEQPDFDDYDSGRRRGGSGGGRGGGGRGGGRGRGGRGGRGRGGGRGGGRGRGKW